MIRWLKDYVAIEPILQAESEGGVLMPQKDNEPMKGRVIGVGTKVSEFRVGDKIIFPRYVGQKRSLDGKEVLIMSDYHILGFL